MTVDFDGRPDEIMVIFTLPDGLGKLLKNENSLMLSNSSVAALLYLEAER